MMEFGAIHPIATGGDGILYDVVVRLITERGAALMIVQNSRRSRFRHAGAVSALVCAVLGVAAAQMPDGVKPQSTADARESREAAPAQSALAAQESSLRSDLVSHPNSASTLYKLALALRQEGKPKESLKVYTQAAKIQKPDADQLRSVALNYVLLNDYPDAIHWLEIAASLDPKNVEVLYSLARCYYTQSQNAKAEELFLRVLQLKPDHLRAEENLGLTYEAENQTDKAESAFRAAVTMAASGPVDEWPFLDLGTFLLDHDRSKEAVPILQKATAIAAKCAACHEKLGRALEESGQVPEGVRELEKAVHLDPANPNVHFELGHAYRQAGDLDKARAEFAVSEKLRQERDKPPAK
jgi:Flp pilus assembly protein TadD